MVLDKGNVKTGLAAELNVGAREKIEGCLLKTALW